MNRGKTVIIPPTRKISTSSLSKASFVGSDQVGGIVEVLDIVPPIPFWAIPSSAHEILNGQAFTFSYCPLVKKSINLEGFALVSITFHKHGGGLLRTKIVEGILGRVRSRFELCHREDGVDSLVTQYLESVGQSTYPFDDLEGADVLLG